MWKMEYGKWKMKYGKWEMGNGAILLARSCGWMVGGKGRGGREEGGYIIDIDFV